jgi:nitrogen fixation/metabolism regulation signal transduction histidine kinase
MGIPFSDSAQQDRALAVAIAAVLIGLLIAWRLRERIARPILALTNAMRGVQETHDFGRNVDVPADGEVEALVAGFNGMLSEIRVRERKWPVWRAK